MKISVKVRDVYIEMDDKNTESFNKSDARIDFVIKIMKSMSDEAIKLLKERKS